MTYKSEFDFQIRLYILFVATFFFTTVTQSTTAQGRCATMVMGCERTPNIKYPIPNTEHEDIGAIDPAIELFILGEKVEG